MEAAKSGWWNDGRIWTSAIPSRDKKGFSTASRPLSALAQLLIGWGQVPGHSDATLACVQMYQELVATCTKPFLLFVRIIGFGRVDKTFCGAEIALNLAPNPCSDEFPSRGDLDRQEQWAGALINVTGSGAFHFTFEKSEIRQERQAGAVGGGLDKCSRQLILSPMSAFGRR